jgi:quercetin dioxygenase-like cupin family protein
MHTPRARIRVPSPGWALRVVVGLTAVTLASAGVALATPGSGITSTNLSVGLFDDLRIKTHVGDHKVKIDTKGASDVYVVHNLIAPGGHTGWHTHLGPSLITVKSGTITAYDGDDPTCSPTVYTAGQGFVDAGDGHVHMLRNESSVAAETIAVQLLPQGAVRRIDAPAPGNCPF